MWKYNTREFKNPGDYYGFIYMIIDDQGGWYIGKKAFTHRKRTKLSKRARKGTRKRITVTYKDSGWENYWGSCKPLLEYINNRGSLDFQKIILKLCKDRASLNYWEVHYLCTKNALFDDRSWNSNIAGKYFKGRIHE